MKNPIKSKTIWFGILVAILPSLPQIQLALKDYPLAVSAIGVLIVILRFFTSEGIGDGQG